MKKEIFTVDFDGKKLVADIISNYDQADVLLLHGAGTTDRTRYNSFRELLAEHNISSCAFDLIGHGETGGDIKETSLKERTDEIVAVVNNLKIKLPLKIIAFSMSGYNAIKLTELLPVESLIMLAPGVYDAKAYEVKFGYGFSDIIREENSWQNSDAWPILNKFQGRILILIGEEDKVIPMEVIEKMYDSSINAKNREVVILPEATHPLGSYLRDHSSVLEFVINKIDQFLK